MTSLLLIKQKMLKLYRNLAEIKTHRNLTETLDELYFVVVVVAAVVVCVIVVVVGALRVPFFFCINTF